LIGKEIAVELKNDVALMGTLHSVDQYLNIKLLNVSVVEEDKFPQLVSENLTLLNYIFLSMYPLYSESNEFISLLTVDEFKKLLYSW
jgi:small nuclear ribonucleoprotein (snRNP)-like protein